MKRYTTQEIEKAFERAWNKIKFWFWWKFKATGKEKTFWQAKVYGTGFSKNGKFIDAKKFHLD